MSRLDHFPGNYRINALIGRTEVGDCWTRAVAPALSNFVPLRLEPYKYLALLQSPSLLYHVSSSASNLIIISISTLELTLLRSGNRILQNGQ